MVEHKRRAEAEAEHEHIKKGKKMDSTQASNPLLEGHSGLSEEENVDGSSEEEEYLFGEEEEEVASGSSEEEMEEEESAASKGLKQEKKEGSRSIVEEKEEEGYAGSSEEEEEMDDGSGSDGEQRGNKFAEGSNAFRAAFSKIMEKKVADDALGPVLSAHKKLIAKKLDEEANELKVKSEAKKEKRLLREKGHVKPENFLDAKEKSLIRLATKGVVKLFNAVSKAQSVQTGYDISKSQGAKAAKKESKAAFLSELRGASISSSSKPAQFSSVTALSSSNMEVKNGQRDSLNEPRWAALRDDFMLTSSRLKDWDKMQDVAAVDVVNEMQAGHDGSSSSDGD
eukprot:Gb_04480 [translate_table: standard]